MKYALVLCLGLLGLTAPLASGQDAADASELTVITSDKLTFDYTQQFALFDGNVVVVDPQMRLTADKMTVTFNSSNRITDIKAEGHVKIMQEDKTAHAEIAQYQVEQGVIIMTGKPQVTRGMDILTGDKITFWRDRNRMLVEPRARLVITPGKRSNADFLGEPGRGR